MSDEIFRGGNEDEAAFKRRDAALAAEKAAAVAAGGPIPDGVRYVGPERADYRTLSKADRRAGVVPPIIGWSGTRPWSEGGVFGDERIIQTASDQTVIRYESDASWRRRCDAAAADAATAEIENVMRDVTHHDHLGQGTVYTVPSHQIARRDGVAVAVRRWETPDNSSREKDSGWGKWTPCTPGGVALKPIGVA